MIMIYTFTHDAQGALCSRVGICVSRTRSRHPQPLPLCSYTKSAYFERPNFTAEQENETYRQIDVELYNRFFFICSTSKSGNSNPAILITSQFLCVVGNFFISGPELSDLNVVATTYLRLLIEMPFIFMRIFLFFNIVSKIYPEHMLTILINKLKLNNLRHTQMRQLLLQIQ